MDYDRMKGLLEEAGLETTNYSGRAMYGKRCLAVEIEDRDADAGALVACRAMFEAAKELDDIPDEDDEGREKAFRELGELMYVLERTRTDSMGLGTVVYWPRLEAK